MLVPKETPKAIVEAYRKAFRDMAKDPDYMAGVVKTLGGYEQVTDAAADALMREGTTIAPEARELVRNYLTKSFNTTF
jgi:hypothetical protein